MRHSSGPFTAFRFLLCIGLALCISGCGGGIQSRALAITGSAISGKVLAGQQPVAGAHVYLLAASVTGVGAASVSLLDTASTGYADSVGTYVLSAADGSFTIPGYYSCTSSQQLYLYAIGGTAGLGENSVAGELAILGICPALNSTVPSITVNEVTTVAAAFAMAPLATDALHVSSSGSARALTGIANAFTNASKLASTATGSALAMIPAGTATVPQSTINTLANILNACIDSSGSSSAACVTLLSSTQAGSSATTDTATAMIDIVHHPASHVGTLFALQTPQSPYSPSLSAVPNDYSVGIVYTGGGMVGVTAMAADSQGNMWVLGEGSGYENFVGTIAEISPSGSYLSVAKGYNANLYGPGAMAIDTSDNVWIANVAASLVYNTSMIELSNSGAVLSGANGFNSASLFQVRSVSIDPSGNLWMTNSEPNSLTEMTPTGQFLSGANGFTGGGLEYPVGLAFEPAGDMWIADDLAFNVSHFSDAGSPLTGSNGFSAPGVNGAADVAIDHQGNVWFTRQGGYAGVSEISNSGSVLSGSGGYTGGGIYTYSGGFHLAIDGDGDVWIPLYNGPGVVELSNSGTIMSGAAGYHSGIDLFPLSIAIDGSGDVWISSSDSVPKPVFYTDRVTELIGVAAPVVTPIAAGVKNNSLGTRP